MRIPCAERYLYIYLGRIQTPKGDEWSWLNHGRYLHSCETFPMKVTPEKGDPYNQQAIIAAGTQFYVFIRSVKLVE